MKKNDEKRAPGDQSDEKLDINKSVFQVSRELAEKRRQEEAAAEEEMRRRVELAEKKKQEAYDRRILEEKKELIRLKQGIIKESETIHEEEAAPVVMTPWQKVRNFFYQNKWWLGFGTIIILIVGYLIYSFLSKPDPDLIVMLACDNDKVNSFSGLQDYLEEFTDDFNDNGKILASVYEITISDNSYANYQNGTDNKLSVEFQSADSVLVIGDQKLTDIIKPEEVYLDLEEMFPDNPYVDGCLFKLSETPFAERIGADDISDDFYMALRKPQDLLYCDDDDVQKTLDKDIEVFKRIVNDLSE